MSDADRAAMLASAEGMIRAAVRSARLPREDADDLAQDCRLQVWRASETFDPARGVKWSSYAGGVIRVVVGRFVAAKRSRPELQNDRRDGFDGFADPRSLADPDAEPDTEDELFAAVRGALAAGLLARCSPLAREVCELVIEGVPLARIAERVGRSVKDVKLVMRNSHRVLSRVKRDAAAVA